MKNVYRFIMVCFLCFNVSGCTNTIKRLQRLGEEPKLNNIEIPNTKPNYKPIKWPRDSTQTCEKRSPNSLWRANSRSFFKDHKARNIGDIIKIKIKVDDKATLNNKTAKQRHTSENLAMPKLFGVQNKLFDPKEKGFSLLDLKGGNNNSGEGKIDRAESINTQIAAIVTQILPNGNMVIMGSQEIRVNFEVRQVSVKGIVRSEDISVDNTVDSDKVAELRVVYGGQGDVTDVQQPRLGTQILDIIAPF